MKNIGIVYAEDSGKGLTHPFFVLILDAFKQEAEAHGYDVTFLNPGLHSMGQTYLQRCHENNLDGVCVIVADYESADIRNLIEGDIPCLTVDHLFKGVPAVLSDNETGVQKLLTYAISRGHKRIAFISGQNNSIVTQTRIRQFINSMEFNRLPIPEGYLREGLYNNIPLTRSMVKDMLRLPERPTCILLPDDICYLGAQDAARDLGLRIPEDISFAGYDGIPLTQSLTPKLTTVHQSSGLIGCAAAQKLIERIENHGSRKTMPTIFPVELIEGGTIEDIRG
ncbi:MAG: substrate-binding domain-containing protein [Blautia sp.]|nr:substrate-binding domain-containing protein [Blautia sp.]